MPKRSLYFAGFMIYLIAAIIISEKLPIMAMSMQHPINQTQIQVTYSRVDEKSGKGVEHKGQKVSTQELREKRQNNKLEVME